jgi:hypothetical protein
VEAFKKAGGFFVPDGSLHDSSILVFVSCVRRNILDSNYQLHFTGEIESAFKEKLKNSFKLREISGNTDRDILSNCIVKRLNGNITISEYFSDDYFKIPRVRKMIEECVKESVIPAK